MRYKTREEKLWDQFQYRLRDGVRDCDTTPLNRRLIYELSCSIWRWRQEYSAQYHIKPDTYNGLRAQIEAVERQIQSGGKYELEARQAVADAFSWLESLLYHRVTWKNRVF